MTAYLDVVQQAVEGVAIACTRKMEASATVESRSRLKRFSHGRRFDIALELLELSGHERVLDYGAGEGFLLLRILDRHLGCRLVGYEPSRREYVKIVDRIGGGGGKRPIAHIELVKNLYTFPARSFDAVCCLEVLEHLSDEQMEKALEDMMRLVADHGKIIISVPIEIGLSSLLKNIARILLRQAHPNTSARTMVYSLFGLKIDRGENRSGHIGFDYRDLENRLDSAGLKITQKVFSPFKPLAGFINSQVFFVLRKR